ncbi:MAG: hypothetical protein WA397_19015 [Roseiarcus sp.]
MGFKFKGLPRELVTLALALLLVKLARDAARLFAVYRFGEIGLELPEKPAPESFVKQDYVRPVDLVDRAAHGSKWQILDALERMRAFLLIVLCVCVAAASAASIGLSVRDMANPSSVAGAARLSLSTSHEASLRSAWRYC